MSECRFVPTQGESGGVCGEHFRTLSADGRCDIGELVARTEAAEAEVERLKAKVDYPCPDDDCRCACHCHDEDDVLLDEPERLPLAARVALLEGTLAGLIEGVREQFAALGVAAAADDCRFARHLCGRRG